MIRVLIAGEGPNEIGQVSPAGSPDGPGRSDGVIEALMSKVRPGGWAVRGVLQWKDVRKLRPNAHEDGEARTVRGLALHARERGCNALIFLRDRDRQVARERSIRDACKLVEVDGGLLVAAGIPIEMLECWLLALRGEPRAHLEPTPAQALEERHKIAPKRTTAMVQLVRNAHLLEAATDAVSFWRWLRRVATALNVRIPKEWPRPGSA
jgi:hypothetical protein